MEDETLVSGAHQMSRCANQKSPSHPTPVTQRDSKHPRPPLRLGNLLIDWKLFIATAIFYSRLLIGCWELRSMRRMFSRKPIFGGKNPEQL